MVDKMEWLLYNNSCVGQQVLIVRDGSIPCFGVWLSLARAPGLGPGGRRFESCHPDVLYEVTGMRYVVNSFYAGVVQW